MELIINKYGTKLKKRGERIVLHHKNTNDEVEYPVRKLSKIIIARPASITTGAVELALEHDVDIVYLKLTGTPFGRTLPIKQNTLTDIKRAQIEASKSFTATHLAKQFLSGKIRNQLRFLEHIQSKNTALEIPREQINSIVHSVTRARGTIEVVRNRLLGLEGRAADLYFQTLHSVITFPNRNPKGNDIFNSSLNYGYGILYNEIEQNVLLVGLDPFIGFLHAERYGNIALVFDLIEEFRAPIVDSCIVRLIADKALSDNNLIAQKNKTLLNKIARRKIIEAIFKKFEQKILFNNESIKLKTVIKYHIRDLAHYLIRKKRNFTPFLFDDYL